MDYHFLPIIHYPKKQKNYSDVWRSARIGETVERREPDSIWSSDIGIADVDTCETQTHILRPRVTAILIHNLPPLVNI